MGVFFVVVDVFKYRDVNNCYIVSGCSWKVALGLVHFL